MAASLLDSLDRAHLLKDREAARGVLRADDAPALVLPRLADAGLLEGGLSASLGVRPEELLAPLTLAMGGAARRFKLLDVRDHPRHELHILAGDVSERWEVEDLSAQIGRAHV